MTRDDIMLRIPRLTSALDFENYLPTKPILSSQETDWQHIMVRLYQELPEQEEMLFPASSDIYLVLITSGTVQVEERDVNGPWEKYIMHEGDWFLSPAGGDPYVLRWQSLSSTPLQTLHIHLNTHHIECTVRQTLDRDPTAILIQERTGFQDPLLTQIALTLQQELQQPASTPIGNLYAETTAQMIATHLLRYYTTTRVSIREYSHKLSSHQIQRLTSFVLTNINQNLSLEMLAQQVGFSPYHFARLFRQTTGESPHQFVLRHRLDTAQRLLKETNEPLIQVALRVGFLNQSHFTQTFKRHLGMTPLVYRHER